VVLLFGDDTIDHELPFHCSIRVCCADAAVYAPTAQQFDVEVQVTPFRRLSAVPALGDGIMAQDEPFQCSIRVLLMKFESV
jgi:hypothetical protein